MIAVATRNRKAITELSLSNLRGFSGGSVLEIWDDQSSEYDPAWLARYGTVHAPGRHRGIDAIRAEQMRRFLRETQYDRLYLTDNDTIHDPNWKIMAELLLLKYGRPVCLFNSVNHAPVIESALDLWEWASQRDTCPGISVYLSRPMVQAIVAEAEQVPREAAFRNWDWTTGRYLRAAGYSYTQTLTSYVEHFGAGGLHNADCFNDIAMFPTHFLRTVRDLILCKRTGDDVTHRQTLLNAVTTCGVRPSFQYRNRPVQQHALTWLVFRYFLASVKPVRIIEIGTGSGGSALMWREIVREIGISADVSVITVDIHPPNRLDELRSSGLQFIEGDWRTSTTYSILNENARMTGTTVILCDGGNNIAEFCAFASSLKVGDYILAHDYAPDRRMFHDFIQNRYWNWCEVVNSDLQETSRANDLENYMPSLFNLIAWVCRKRIR